MPKNPRNRRKNKNVPTPQPKLFCPRTMVRYDGSHADYPTKWVCKMCLKVLLSEAAVKNHLNTCSALNREPEPAPTNNEIAPYICKYCDRVFSRGVTLKRHLEDHEKPPDLPENEVESKLNNLKTERKN